MYLFERQFGDDLGLLLIYAVPVINWYFLLDLYEDSSVNNVNDASNFNICHTAYAGSAIIMGFSMASWSMLD